MSKTYSILELFGNRNLREALYVVHSSNSVVYVGMARVQCVCDRMARHIGDVFARDKPSKFSSILLRSHPSYFQWKVEIFNHLDVEKLTSEKFCCLPCAERSLYDYYTQLQGCTPEGNAKRPSHGCEL